MRAYLVMACLTERERREREKERVSEKERERERERERVRREKERERVRASEIALSFAQAFFTGRVPPAPNGTLDGNTTGAEEQHETAAPGGTPGNFTGGGNLTGHTVEALSSTLPSNVNLPHAIHVRWCKFDHVTFEMLEQRNLRTPPG